MIIIQDSQDLMLGDADNALCADHSAGNGICSNNGDCHANGDCHGNGVCNNSCSGT